MLNIVKDSITSMSPIIAKVMVFLADSTAVVSPREVIYFTPPHMMKKSAATPESTIAALMTLLKRGQMQARVGTLFAAMQFESVQGRVKRSMSHELGTGTSGTLSCAGHIQILASEGWEYQIVNSTHS